MLKRLFFFYILCGLAGGAYAQQFGGIPPSLQWKQINTDSIRVIFPKGFESLATQIANTTNYINRHERASIGEKQLKLNVILQNYTTAANGFVALGPFRSVFQTTPPADNFSLGTLNWINELSLHEYWHALQNMNFRSGIGKTFYHIFGDNGQAFVTNLLIPDWFWEGDAVFMETAMSNQGRGRLPSFLEPFKSLSYAGKNYSWAKIRNGSLRDMVPDHYPLGYMMSAYGRNTYGPDFWKNIMSKTLLDQKAVTRWNLEYPDRPYHLFRYGFYPLGAALKYQTGVRIKGFYRKSLGYFAEQWQEQKDKPAATPAETVLENHSKSLLNYRHPHILADSSLIVLKEGYAVTPQVIRIAPSGEETTLVKMGHLQDSYYACADDKIAWTEYRPDPRWGWVDYTILRLYDMRTKQTKTLSSRTRYFSPSLSPDGETICVVSVAPGLKYRLLLLDARTGAVEKTFPNPEEYEYTYPVFSENGASVITAIRDSAGRMALARLNRHTGRPAVLTPFITKPFGPPQPAGPYILFPAGLDNNVQLYVFNTENKKLYQIAERPLGNYSIAADTRRKKLFFDEYTAKGYSVKSIAFDPATWKPVNWSYAGDIHDPYVPAALKNGGGNILDRIPDREYTPSAYNGLRRLFKIHSWSFLPDFPDIGLYLQSQNMLQTLQLNAGGGYDLNEKTPFISAFGIFGGWFPFFKAGYKETFNRSSLIGNNTTITWDESNAYLGFDIPLNLSKGLYNRSVDVGSSFNINSLHFKNSAAVKAGTENITYTDSYLTFSNTHVRPVQAFYPKFGQALSLRYRTTLNNLFGWQWTAGLNLFFPGLAPNHSFYITAAFSTKDKEKEYKFSDDFSYAAGYNTAPYYNIYRAGFNYQLPVAYPDFGVSWAYLMRIRVNLSFDYSHASLIPPVTPPEATYRSAGIAAFLDTKLFSALSVPIGLRYAYLLDRDFEDPGKKQAVQITFPITF